MSGYLGGGIWHGKLFLWLLLQYTGERSIHAGKLYLYTYIGYFISTPTHLNTYTVVYYLQTPSSTCLFTCLLSPSSYSSLLALTTLPLPYFATFFLSSLCLIFSSPFTLPPYIFPRPLHFLSPCSAGLLCIPHIQVHLILSGH